MIMTRTEIESTPSSPRQELFTPNTHSQLPTSSLIYIKHLAPFPYPFPHPNPIPTANPISTTHKMTTLQFTNTLRPIIPWAVPIVPTRTPNRPFSDPGPFLCPVNECGAHYSTRENLAIHLKFSHSRHPLCIGGEGNEIVHPVRSAEEGEGEEIEKVLRRMGREFFERKRVRES